MGDIELVIKISEEEYINIKEAIIGLLEEGLNRASLSQVCLAILEGTPLPKGHGRIGDLDALREEVCSLAYWGMNNYEPSDFIDAIDEADTIIEADRSKEE